MNSVERNALILALILVVLVFIGEHLFKLSAGEAVQALTLSLLIYVTALLTAD